MSFDDFQYCHFLMPFLFYLSAFEKQSHIHGVVIVIRMLPTRHPAYGYYYLLLLLHLPNKEI